MGSGTECTLTEGLYTICHNVSNSWALSIYETMDGLCSGLSLINHSYKIAF